LVNTMIDEGDAAAPKTAAVESRFDRRELWRHSVAVACAAELIAEVHGGKTAALDPSEAFVCGLLHDLGKLALDRVLPKTYARVVSICDQRQDDIAELEKAIIGLDHHTAGKRIAENWGLPHQLQDVMWLHGHEAEAVPYLAHRPMIGAVHVADVLVRRMHLGWSGNFKPISDFDAACRSRGLDPAKVESVQSELLDRVRQRSAELGLEEEEDRDILMRAVAEANRRLGRIGSMLDERSRESERDGAILAALGSFNHAVRANSGLVPVMSEVVRSAKSILGEGSYSLMWQSRTDGPIHLFRFGPDSTVREVTEVEPPKDPPAPGKDHAADQLPDWARAKLNGAIDPWRARILSLTCGGGPRVLLIHDREGAESAIGARAMTALTASWAWALSAAAQHQGARKLGEQVAEANRRLVQMQHSLVESRSMARLGEVAAGAAHEMNNPLAVISGQSQLLSRVVMEPTQRESLRRITEASEKLSEMITGLHEYASPPKPVRKSTSLGPLVLTAAEEARKKCAASGAPMEVPIRLNVADRLQEAWIDADQIGRALAELLVNAVQSGPKTAIEVGVHVDPLDDRLYISVKDDGAGMSDKAIQHAFDPFFSERPAGRSAGMGLALAQRFASGSGGEIELRSAEGEGTTARIVFSNWRKPTRAPATGRAA
ncbi:MAG TPA: HDOD domain-containing protein, partial [Phycisphaerales bacterium]|nr:HDOD domain-containing protein [Phycisphaerales bacterium]